MEDADIIRDIVDGGVLEALIAMVNNTPSNGKLRLMAVEALRIVSDDIRMGLRLYDAGAAEVLGKILRQNISILFNCLQQTTPRATMSFDSTIADDEDNERNIPIPPDVVIQTITPHSGPIATTPPLSSSNIINNDDKNNNNDDDDALQELYHALYTLANMLEPNGDSSFTTDGGYSMNQSTTSHTVTPVGHQWARIGIQTAKSGGLESLLLMASLPMASPSSYVSSSFDSNGFLLESFRCLASLCPLLLTAEAEKEGFAKWAGDVLLALTGVLKRGVKTTSARLNNNLMGEEQQPGLSSTTNMMETSPDWDVLMLRELQLDALRGLCSLAEYEPLKIRIVYESLPELLRMKNHGGGEFRELAQNADEVFLALGFSEEEIDVHLTGNDPKLLADWFCLKRSIFIQAMARDEIIKALYLIWGPAWMALEKEITNGLGCCDVDYNNPVIVDTVNEAKQVCFSLSDDMELLMTSNDIIEIPDHHHHLSSPTYPPPCTSQPNNNNPPNDKLNQTIHTLRHIFPHLALNDETSSSLRETMLQQYGNIYEKSPSDAKQRRASFTGDEGSPYHTGDISKIKSVFHDHDHLIVSPGFAAVGGVTKAMIATGTEADEEGGDDEEGVGEVVKGGDVAMGEVEEEVVEEGASLEKDLLGSHPYPVHEVAVEKDWILAHRKAMMTLDCSDDDMTNYTAATTSSTVVSDEDDHFKRPLKKSPSIFTPTVDVTVPLPRRAMDLLDFYFPSKLFREETLPISDFCANASFNFLALAMPERTYFSFRREGQILFRIYDLFTDDDNANFLCFNNSNFAGEFAETLVQALYRCPVIKGLSFSRRERKKGFGVKSTTRQTGIGNSSGNGNRRGGSGGASDGEAYDESVHLTYLAGNLPPWITFFALDNVLTKRTVAALMKIFETRGHRGFSSSNAKKRHFTPGGDNDGDYSSVPTSARDDCKNELSGLTGLAITNSPHLEATSFHPIFNLLGYRHLNNQSQSPLLNRPPLLLLRILDLSGNKLGDNTCAHLLSIVYRESARCSLERLDLSGNEIGEARNVLAVLTDYVRQYRQTLLSDDDDGGGKNPHRRRAAKKTRAAVAAATTCDGMWRSTLNKLNLSQNHLREFAATRIVGLLKGNALGLQSLGLSHNGLTGDKKGSFFLDSLVNAIATKKNELVELDLSGNEFSHTFIDSLLQMLLSSNARNESGRSSSMNSSALAFLHLDDNDPLLTKTQRKHLRRFLTTAREEKVRRHFRSKRKQNVSDNDVENATTNPATGVGGVEDDENIYDYDVVPHYDYNGDDYDDGEGSRTPGDSNIIDQKTMLVKIAGERSVNISSVGGGSGPRKDSGERDKSQESSYFNLNSTKLPTSPSDTNKSPYNTASSTTTAPQSRLPANDTFDDVSKHHKLKPTPYNAIRSKSESILGLIAKTHPSFRPPTDEQGNLVIMTGVSDNPNASSLSPPASSKYLRRYFSPLETMNEEQPAVVPSSPSAVVKSIKAKKRREPGKITVLFSAPLVWRDSSTQEYQPIEMLDFELERELLWQSFKEASMDIELYFNNATAGRLQAAATKSCECLHYSGHGHTSFLIFEDGKGGLHQLGADQIKNLVSSSVKEGGVPFKFVFVSACHSGLAGETFVKSGVPHVVCCQQESQLMDCAALAFTRAFYFALAIGRTVKESFEIGRQAVLVAPSVPNSDKEMKKFVLLPEDGNHDEPIFDAQPVEEWPMKTSANNPFSASSQRKLSLRPSKSSGSVFNSFSGEDPHELPLPIPPQGFLGREVDMYHVLNAVLARRFVNLVGPPGMGRSSLATALCHYINDRKNTMITIEKIFYIRATPARGNDLASSFITSLHKLLISAGIGSPVPKSADLDGLFKSIFKSLSKTKALIVFDRAETMEGSMEAQEFPLFLSTLFRETKNARVLMTSRKKLGLSSLGGVGEHVFKLGPLNFKNTVRLFGILCPHLHTGRERMNLLELLAPDEKQQKLCVNDERMTKRSRTILNLLGDGVPSKTFDVAYNMSKENFCALKEMARSTLDNFDCCR